MTMASGFLNKMMRSGSECFNGLPLLSSGGVITLHNAEGVAHSVVSPLLVRFKSGVTLELSAGIPTLEITAATTFGLPAYFQGPLPLNIGIARTGTTTGVLVVSRDTPQFVTADGNITTDPEGVLSNVALAAIETIWPWTIEGYSRSAGLWVFSGAQIVSAHG